MARQSPKGTLRRLGDLRIPVPNDALQEWLTGEQCRDAVTDIAERVLAIYVENLPASAPPRSKKQRVYSYGDNSGPGNFNLKRHAGIKRAIRTDPGQTPRWQAWVVNTALSYRSTQGKPYPQWIEYKYSRGGALRRAADRVAGQLIMLAETGAPLPPRRDQVRPARPPQQPARPRGKGQMSLAERNEAIRRARQGRGYRPDGGRFDGGESR